MVVCQSACGSAGITANTQIAEIAGCLGGTLEISCRGQTFAVGAKEIWNAVCEQFGEEKVK